MQLCDFRHVRQFLTHDPSVLVANALVSSLLDYCKTLLRSLSKSNLCKLQCIQKVQLEFYQIPVDTRVDIRYTPVHEKLHCLPVEHCSLFKTATHVYKFFYFGFPQVFCFISLFLQQFLQYQVQSEFW